MRFKENPAELIGEIALLLILFGILLGMLSLNTRITAIETRNKYTDPLVQRYLKLETTVLQIQMDVGNLKSYCLLP